MAEFMASPLWHSLVLLAQGLALIAFLMLLVSIQSVLLALKGVVMTVLSVAAAYGSLVMVFQWGWLERFGFASTGSIDTFIPPLVLAMTFGLSMDYEIFLLTRIRERFLQTGNTHDAVAYGVSTSARTITSAALIMIAVFIAFINQPLPFIQIFGFALGVAVLFDAFFVRMSLVPAIMQLLGDKAWWLPGWLDRCLPRLDIEGEGIAHEEKLAAWPTSDHTEALHAEGIGVDGLFEGLDLHVEPCQVQAIVGSQSSVSAVLLAVGGRLPLDYGRMRSGGLLLPERASRVRRVAWFLDSSSPNFVEDLEAAMKAVTHPPRRFGRPPRLFLIDHADRIVDPTTRDLLKSLAREVGDAAVILGAQRRGRIDWLCPQTTHDLTETQLEPSLGGAR